ncbi:hypothetical protein ACTXL6_00355 [Brachybacterium tyrofermentans]|uniref:hypothetical protein n=1 Tax=Brachybacterium tyrofermentans TaxID=47848 RepID=UPI003FD31C5B
MTLKPPEQIAREELPAYIGDSDTSDGFDHDDMWTFAVSVIRTDSAQLATALRGTAAVAGLRPFPRATVSALLDAYAKWDGEVDTFCLAWDNYTAGLDFPCPGIEHGVHSTYLVVVSDGSCDFCGDKNRG